MKRTAVREENHKEGSGNAEITSGSSMVTAALNLIRNRQEHTINVKITFLMKKWENLAFDTLKNPHWEGLLIFLKN